MDILIPEEVAVSMASPAGDAFDIVYDGGLWRDPQRLALSVRETRTLMVRNQTQVTAELLASAPKLVAVGRLGVGLDNIDVDAASDLGIVVIVPLEANAVSVAELAMGLMLALARKIPRSDRSTKAGAWDRQGGMGLELQHKTLAVCGFGRIGRLVATRARAFGMRLVIYDPLIPKDLPALGETDARLCQTLAEALGQADFVTVHLPLTTQTRQLFNRQMFEVMKTSSFFINTSRGGVVDEAALGEALKHGRLAGAALDVRETEPPRVSVGFEEMENVILTPHVGAATAEAQTRTFETVASDIHRLLRGEPAVNFVNFDRPRRAQKQA